MIYSPSPRRLSTHLNVIPFPVQFVHTDWLRPCSVSRIVGMGGNRVSDCMQYDRVETLVIDGQPFVHRSSLPVFFAYRQWLDEKCERKAKCRTQSEQERDWLEAQ